MITSMKIEQERMKEELAIQRRRQSEQERKERFFDAKKRMFGVDVKALEQQIKEKQEREMLEKERDAFYDKQRILDSQRAEQMHKTIEQARRRILEQINEYRQKYQQKTSTREFDLNDPDYLKKDKPARIGDDDPRCGVASLQKFHGEDLTRDKRIQAQREQMRTWIAQQIDEKAKREELEKNEQLAFEQRQEMLNKRAITIENQIKKAKADLERAVKEFNIEMAKAKRDEERERKMKETLDKMEEIRNQMESDFLNESFDTTLHAFKPGRFRRDHFKQLSPEQYKEIEETRRRQLLEKQQAEAERIEEERRYVMEQKYYLRQGIALERERQRKLKEKELKLAEERKIQAMEAKKRKEELDKVYANEITEDFFNAFNQSSR